MAPQGRVVRGGLGCIVGLRGVGLARWEGPRAVNGKADVDVGVGNCQVLPGLTRSVPSSAGRVRDDILSVFQQVLLLIEGRPNPNNCCTERNPRVECLASSMVVDNCFAIVVAALAAPAGVHIGRATFSEGKLV